MLPPVLIRARRKKGKIIPEYVNEEYIGLAKTLIEVYNFHIDKTRSELNDAVKNCEELGYDFKLVRGLTEILNSLCIFGVRSVLPALTVRKILFEESAKYSVISKEERIEILLKTSSLLNTSVNDLEESLYSDLLEEQHLIDFNVPEPKELFQKYNYALVIALLTYAKTISIFYSSEDHKIEQTVKTLDHVINRGKENTKITLQLKPTKQISIRGNKIEKVIAHLLTKEDWKIEAHIAYPPKYKTECLLELDKITHDLLLKPDKIEEEIIIEINESKKKSRFGEIISIDDTANKLGITDKELIKEIQKEGIKYVKKGGILFYPSKFNEIKNALEEVEDYSLKTYINILKKHGCKNPLEVLEAFNYLIEPGDKKGEEKVYTLKKDKQQVNIIRS